MAVHNQRKVLPMKVLFSIRNMLTANQSLKKFAWYLWY
jgi:hypothetical protein